MMMTIGDLIDEIAARDAAIMDLTKTCIILERRNKELAKTCADLTCQLVGKLSSPTIDEKV